MKKSIAIVAFMMTVLTVVSCDKKAAPETTPAQTTTEQTTPENKENEAHELAYACPMDCENGKTYDKPGKCPVCEMDLTEVKAEGHEGHQH